MKSSQVKVHFDSEVDFHEHRDRIVMMAGKNTRQKACLKVERKNRDSYYSRVPARLAEVMAIDLAEVEHVTEFSSNDEIMGTGRMIFSCDCIFSFTPNQTLLIKRLIVSHSK